MNIEDYKTPETDAAEIYVKTFSKKGRLEGMNSHARDLERRLAMCREALKNIASAVVMKSRDSGKCVSDNVIDEAKQALESTKPKP